MKWLYGTPGGFLFSALVLVMFGVTDVIVGPAADRGIPQTARQTRGASREKCRSQEHH